jgi:phosphate acetyltransferase
MPRMILLMPISTGASLTNISLGMMRALARQGVRLGFFKPVAQAANPTDQDADTPFDLTTKIIHTHAAIGAPPAFSLSFAEQLISQHKTDELLEQIVARFTAYSHEAAVIVIEGLVPTQEHPYTHELNCRIAQALNADIVLVVAPGEERLAKLRERLDIANAHFGKSTQQSIAGIIVNCLDLPLYAATLIQHTLDQQAHPNHDLHRSNPSVMQLLTDNPYPLLGYIPWELEVMACRAMDIARHLKATIINAGEMKQRRLKSIIFCAHSIPHMLSYFQPGALLVTSADRADVVLAASLAALNGIAIGALLLTGGFALESNLKEICARAFEAGLPVFAVESNTWQTAMELQRFSRELPIDDHQRIEAVQGYIADQLNSEWITTLTTTITRPSILSPPAFRYRLTELARQANKRIVLPEGDEPRTIRAAAICAERQMARCVLLGDPTRVRRLAQAEGITLGATVEILDPEPLRNHYLPRLLALRQQRGMTPLLAREWLQDNVVLGTLMLEQAAVDGLVSGAVHTTANTIRPALQLIKTAPGSPLVSSLFFMLLPDQVLVYGDCAINPDPTAEQLAAIAIQSADSAAAFGIEPRVAMISYSTGHSGSGSDVDKVRTATQIAQQCRPDLIIDGPLQYDAAIMAEVAQFKAPNSPVAGKATVFIFPDLNTGNTTYKAVQRSANLLSIGPMLQGLRQPVNDLSRGASVDDIVYTIALTAIQAAQNRSTPQEQDDAAKQ